MFRYGYAVTDDQGLDFNQQETSDGGVVTGSYSVVLPDGRIQTVTYSVAPDTGYVVSSTVQYSTVQYLLKRPTSTFTLKNLLRHYAKHLFYT